ncbi:hypothetical protein PMAYCL1PPCAC_19239, partial [Pristionchus mayeri]
QEVLSARIPFFHGLFNANMTECANGVVDLSSAFSDTGFSSLENLLQYAYTGCLAISELNVQDLMMGASFLSMDSILDECAEFMRRRMTIDNVFPLLFFCRDIGYKKIHNSILNFIDKNFVSISRTSGFRNLSVDDLVVVLQRDSLYVDKEDQV